MKKITSPRREAGKAIDDLGARFCRGEVPEAELEKQLPGLMEKAAPSARDNLKVAQTLSSKPLPEPNPFLVLPEAVQRWGAAWPYIRPAKQFVLTALGTGDPQPFFRTLGYWPILLTDLDIYKQSVAVWHQQKHHATAAGHRARKWLKQIGSVLANPYGAPELPPEEREAIQVSCKKWRPICEGLNEAFKGNKGLWALSEYWAPGLHQKEARGLLAEKYKISVKEVKTIERVLKAPSRRSNKSTPTAAMLQMVALDHPNRDPKTIERIWGDYLKKYPEERRKKRRSTT